MRDSTREKDASFANSPERYFSKMADSFIHSTNLCVFYASGIVGTGDVPVK